MDSTLDKEYIHWDFNPFSWLVERIELRKGEIILGVWNVITQNVSLNVALL